MTPEWSAADTSAATSRTVEFVFGVEGDIEGKGISHSFFAGPPFSADTVFTVRSDLQGSVRGRLGLAADRVLIYMTGGVTFAQFRHTYLTPPGVPFFDSVSRTRAGGTIGAGVEYALSGNWTGRAEYRYSNFGTFRNNLPTFLAPPGWSDVRIDEHTFRLGISYRLGGPVVARF